MKQTEHAGVYGGGSQVSYLVFLTVKKKHLQYFDSAWAFDNGSLIILKTLKNTPVKDLKFRKKKQYNLQINIAYNVHPSGDTGPFTRKKKPLECTQELIMRYKAKKKYHYIVLSNFKIQPTINLP